MVRVEVLLNFYLTYNQLKDCLEVSIAAGIHECLQDEEQIFLTWMAKLPYQRSAPLLSSRRKQASALTPVS